MHNCNMLAAAKSVIMHSNSQVAIPCMPASYLQPPAGMAVSKLAKAISMCNNSKLTMTYMHTRARYSDPQQVNNAAS